MNLLLLYTHVNLLFQIVGEGLRVEIPPGSSPHMDQAHQDLYERGLHQATAIRHDPPHPGEDAHHLKLWHRLAVEGAFLNAHCCGHIRRVILASYVALMHECCDKIYLVGC